jgi:ABC-type dipeptide/oligopeptide/nickel transport system permease subunit
MGFMATTQGTRRIGALALNAVSYADWPVFQGVLLVGAAVLVLAIFARDVLLAVSARIAAGSSPANVVSTEAAVPFVGDPVLNLGRLDLSPVPGGSTGVWERFRRQRIGWLGLGLIAVLLLITLLGPIVSPYSATEIPMNVPYDVLTNRGPFSTIVDEAGEAHFHVLGTDRSGRDKATRMLVAGRQALLLALAAAGLCTALGVLVGAVGARLGGITNRVIAAVTDLVAASAGPFYAFPLVVATLYLAGAGSAFRGASGFLAALLLCGWVGAAAHTRDWLTATRVSQDDPAPVLGAGNPPSRAAADARPMNGETARTGLHRLLPALAANAAFIASWVIIADVFFAFVGYGVIGAAVVPDPSWGNMLRDAQGMMFTAPWVVFLPLAALILTCLPFNLVGMALRRALDPTWAS